jgi:quercetin 2,3-dioxygenase
MRGTNPVEHVPSEGSSVTAAMLPAGALTEIFQPRSVPPHWPGAVAVRRTLPSRRRFLLGPWCLADLFGPEDVSVTHVQAPPHPHIGTQTLTWLFSGELEHWDSAGNHTVVRPGELNLMSAGSGICHSEAATGGSSMLHGVRLWIALPAVARFTDPGLARYVPPVTAGDGYEVRVLLGSLCGSSSPVRTFSPLLGAEIRLAPDADVQLAAEAAFEYGVLVASGSLSCNGTTLLPNELGFLPAGTEFITLSTLGRQPALILVLGGRPLGEPIVMWWNFVGRSHEEIADARSDWEEQIGGEPFSPTPLGQRPARFGSIAGNRLAPLPAPHLPPSRLPRRA